MSETTEPFTVVLATRNANKVKEIAAIFQEDPIRFLTPDDFPGAPEVHEDGRTLEDNARKKAYTIAHFSNQIALADDSGLEVAFLDGAPGVNSARFAGVGCSYNDNNQKLLGLLKGVPTEHRKACFRSIIALAVPGGATQTVEGKIDGYILDRPRGTEGFGYDPIFLVPELGKTFAEMPPSQKNSISHRFKALQAIRPVLLALRENILDAKSHPTVHPPKFGIV